MSKRERLSWKTRKKSKRRQRQAGDNWYEKTADPYTMNQDRTHVPTEEYMIGDPSAWAEDPVDDLSNMDGTDRDELGLPAHDPESWSHKGEDEWGADGNAPYDNDHTFGPGDRIRGREAQTVRQAKMRLAKMQRHFEKKALQCVRIAEALLPKADEDVIAQQALDFMPLPDDAVIETTLRLEDLGLLAEAADEDGEEEKDASKLSSAEMLRIMEAEEAGDDAGDEGGDDAGDDAGDEGGDDAGDDAGDEGGDDAGDDAGEEAEEAEEGKEASVREMIAQEIAKALGKVAEEAGDDEGEEDEEDEGKEAGDDAGDDAEEAEEAEGKEAAEEEKAEEKEDEEKAEEKKEEKEAAVDIRQLVAEELAKALGKEAAGYDKAKAEAEVGGDLDPDELLDEDLDAMLSDMEVGEELGGHDAVAELGIDLEPQLDSLDSEALLEESDDTLQALMNQNYGVEGQQGKQASTQKKVNQLGRVKEAGSTASGNALEGLWESAPDVSKVFS